MYYLFIINAQITLRTLYRSMSQILVVIGYIFAILIVSSSFMFIAEEQSINEEGHVMRYNQGKLEVR